MEWVKMSNCKDQALFLGFITKNSRFMVVNDNLIAPTVLDQRAITSYWKCWVVVIPSARSYLSCEENIFDLQVFYHPGTFHLSHSVWKTSHDFFLFTIPTIHVLNELLGQVFEGFCILWTRLTCGCGQLTCKLYNLLCKMKSISDYSLPINKIFFELVPCYFYGYCHWNWLDYLFLNKIQEGIGHRRLGAMETFSCF